MIRTVDTSPDDLKRIPGLFRRWELAEIIESGQYYRIEDAGEAGDGTLLFAVYRSVPMADAQS